MNKYIVFNAIPALFLLVGLDCSLHAEDNSARLVETIRPAVVALVTYNDRGEVIECGNGFFISSDGRLLSSRHLLRHASSAEVRTRDGEIYPIRMVLSEDSNFDLIELLIDPDSRAMPYLTMADVNAIGGERVTAFGHQHIVQGFVSQLRAHSESSGNFLLTTDTNARATGGPVVNEKGQVIAIATEQTVEEQTLVLAIASSRVLALKSERALTIDNWNRTAKDDSAATDGLFFAAASMIANKDYLRALPLLQEAARRNSRDAQARFYCGYVKTMLHRYDEAIQYYREAIRIATSWVEALNNLGAMYHESGRLADALEMYNRAIELKPDFAIAYRNLAAVLDRLGRREEAIAAYRNAIRLRPDSASTFNQLGMDYYKLGRLQEAIDSFRSALQLKPDFGEAHYNLSVSYLALGDNHSAFETYGKVKSLNQKLASRLFDLLEKQYTVSAASNTAKSINGFASLESPASRTAIRDLMKQVNDLIARGTLHRETADGLIAELEIANNQPDTNNAIIKINMLNHFIERLSDLVRAQEISEDEGQPLVDAANIIIDRLSR